MRLQVTQENLNKALANVAKVAISSRNPLPILNNVLLKTVNNRLLISATNLEIAISEYVGAKIADEGAITIPARLLQEYVSSLPGGVIDMSVKDHKLSLSTGGYKSTINGMTAEDFPVMPLLERDNPKKINSKKLKKSLNQVIFAAASDDTRPILTAVYMHTHEGFLHLVATDSYRLAEDKLLAISEEIGLLVPHSSLQDLLRIIGDQDSDIDIYADGQQALFVIGESELITRLIDGNYPDYRKLIPNSFDVSVTLDRTEFLNVTKVASLFARESAGSIILKFDELEKTVSISSVASQLGENISTITAEVEGNGEVSLNSRYLIDALNAFNSEKVTFSCNGKVEPCVLTSVQQPDYTHVVMPLKS